MVPYAARKHELKPAHTAAMQQWKLTMEFMNGKNA